MCKGTVLAYASRPVVSGYDPTVRNVLILGGTAEARALAEALVGEGVDVTSSLAGLKSVLAARPLEQVEPHDPRA